MVSLRKLYSRYQLHIKNKITLEDGVTFVKKWRQFPWLNVKVWTSL